MPRNGCDAPSSASGGGCGGEGCLYPDDVIMKKGVTFNVRYTGCVEVKTSMKLLDFNTRTQVARECINRVCEAAGLKSAGKRRIDKKILQYISDRPCMQSAGTNVVINVSSRALSLVNVETGELIASHNMPRISFASGGDSDTLDFLAYIAKNEDEWRACYVLECIGGQSEDLIVTIGKAFMLRYDALNRKTHQPPENYDNGKENEKDYYNDLPDKLPPDLLTESDLQQLRLQQEQQSLPPPHKVSQLNLKKPRDRLSSNLIDLNSPPPDQTTSKMNLSSFDPMKESNADDASGGATGGAAGPTTPPVRDVFDMQPFALSPEEQRSQLLSQPWFHIGVTRPMAEGLLKQDGDFLVRESQGKQGQYVLTGLEGQTPKHLLLIDPEGVVRTKDAVFDSISHLINYHYVNALPIISEDTELVLRSPVANQSSQQLRQAQQLQQQQKYNKQRQEQTRMQ